MPGVDGWQLSNANIIAAAAATASLEIFGEVGMAELRKKSLRLTGYAEWLINDLASRNKSLEIITPANPEARGWQLSIQLHKNGRAIFDYMHNHGVIGDWREPNQENEQAGVIRIAPVPLYNSYVDVFRFSKILADAINKDNG